MIRYLVGDALDGLRSLDAGSVDLVLTSPPYLALRSYLPADHPDKDKEIGSEADPAEFLDALLDVVVECRRVLAPHGSLVFELGDTYSGSGGAGGDYNPDGLRDGQQKFDGSDSRRGRIVDRNSGRRNPTRFDAADAYGGADNRVGTDRYPGGFTGRRGHGAKYTGGRRVRAVDVEAGLAPPQQRPGPNQRDEMNGWPLAKSLCLIPGMFAASLAYGRNLLRPERTIAPWRVRNEVVWCRPNPPVGRLGDKFRPATTYLTVACTSIDRWFDLDAVRTEPQQGVGYVRRSAVTQPGGAEMFRDHGGIGRREEMANNLAGAPPLDWWEIPTEGYKGSHYATFPRKLLDRPILAMCPRRVCLTCGKPSERIVETGELQATESARIAAWDRGKPDDAEKTGSMAEGLRAGGFIPNHERPRETVGWTDCGHDAWRPGRVLDPFGGSGTTGQIATAHGRDAILIDIDERNAVLAEQRCGLFLTIEHLAVNA